MANLVENLLDKPGLQNVVHSGREVAYALMYDNTSGAALKNTVVGSSVAIGAYTTANLLLAFTKVTGEQPVLTVTAEVSPDGTLWRRLASNVGATTALLTLTTGAELTQSVAIPIALPSVGYIRFTITFNAALTTGLTLCTAHLALGA